MPIYNITYATQNTYSALSKESVLEFLVSPTKNDTQEILESSFEINPDTPFYFSENIYGFESIRFRLKNQPEKIEFKYNAIVDKKEINPFDFLPIPYEEEISIIHSDYFGIDHFPFLSFDKYTRIPADYSCPIMQDGETVFDFLKRINQFVNTQLTYDSSITDAYRKLETTLLDRKGVCQDYAHFMLAILRVNKVPARYVSGYLNQGDSIIGAGAIHAWVQAKIPGVGWVGFDPTNNLLEDFHYIKISHGVDISDCPALKGVIKGTGENYTSYNVSVKEQIKEANQ